MLYHQVSSHISSSTFAHISSDHHSMENLSVDKFSFPTSTIPVEEQGAGFEFGCKTPVSPKSPADHLFFNGKLQPHIFPCQQPPNLNLNNLSRSTSRTSSNGSMDSLLSSRSNSTGSGSTRSCRSSCTSSARTSISEASSGDRKITITPHQNAKPHGASRKNGKSRRRGDSLWDHYQTKKPALTPHFSSSRRWQFITPAPGPTVRCQSSLRTNGRNNGGEGSASNKDNMAGNGSWFDGRFFKWFVSACLSCYTTTSINSLTDKEYNEVY